MRARSQGGAGLAEPVHLRQHRDPQSERQPGKSRGRRTPRPSSSCCACSIFAANPEQAGRTALITEVMDSDSQELVFKAGVNDFIISNRLVSNMLAQISEEPDLKDVYDSLFEESGSEIYLKPASLYFETLPPNCASPTCVASKRREICLGVRLASLAERPRGEFRRPIGAREGHSIHPDAGRYPRRGRGRRSLTRRPSIHAAAARERRRRTRSR